MARNRHDPLARFGRRGTALSAAAVLGVAAVAVSAALARSGGPETARAPGDPAALRVVTYNIREDMDAPPRDWETRLPVMIRQLRRHAPDLLGVQEALWRQVRDLDGELGEALGGYGVVGMGREGGTRDEATAILYREDRLELRESGHFWLSSTPTVPGSITWGNRYPRMVTWALFRDRRGGGLVYHLNTHLDNHSGYSRVRSARMILDRVRAFRAGVPVLLTGDFNTPAGGGDAYRVLTAPGAFADTWNAARAHGPDYNTYGGWRKPLPGGWRIDWILARGAVATTWSEIAPYQEEGRYPSDHYPVIAHVTIGKNR
ncbi:endonuclease/exonuclease/phosphatase family protein [Actinomadura sp. 21ATH]|uniref:endonuclease/exonuclease/phosphatase family protein n=1 Tax=Actinomadura sp. 21ATH TaxID=1735444 RepID=UPI0035BF9B30